MEGLDCRLCAEAARLGESPWEVRNKEEKKIQIFKHTAAHSDLEVGSWEITSLWWVSLKGPYSGGSLIPS